MRGHVRMVSGKYVAALGSLFLNIPLLLSGRPASDVFKREGREQEDGGSAEQDQEGAGQEGFLERQTGMGYKYKV